MANCTHWADNIAKNEKLLARPCHGSQGTVSIEQSLNLLVPGAKSVKRQREMTLALWAFPSKPKKQPGNCAHSPAPRARQAAGQHT